VRSCSPCAQPGVADGSAEAEAGDATLSGGNDGIAYRHGPHSLTCK
jgi:hypothetical protein